MASWENPFKAAMSLITATALAAAVVTAAARASTDLHPASSTPMASNWWIPLGSAAIGAFAALVTPLLKDYVLAIASERRSERASQSKIIRNYIAPLSETCEKLVWRFTEIFVASRHHFLKTATLPLTFNEYKRRSTLYRIACLLGWMRAIRLELSSLPQGRSAALTPIASLLNTVGSALADGPFVEMHRLEQLCSLWRIDLTHLQIACRKRLAADIEVELYRLAGDALKNDSRFLETLQNDDKIKICTGIASFLASSLNRTKLTSAVISETCARAIESMSYREALIYRDWQDAIGDAMLEVDPDSTRRYRVKGYAAFELILKDGPIWFDVFKHSIDDIDFDTPNPNDFRAKQLRDLATAVARLLIALSHTSNKDLIADETRAAAESLLLPN